MSGALLAAQQSAPDHLQHALYLADLNNWNGAAADFAEAEKRFASAGDRRNALYAKLGSIRATVLQRDLLNTSAQLEEDLEQNLLLQTDQELRMFCLIVKGDIDGEIDSGAMRKDWEEVQGLARQLKDVKWQYRSLGQIGMAAFYDGDLETARKNVAAALIAATKNNDAGAQIRFLTAMGVGLHEAHSRSAALEYFENALKVAAATPDAGYQFATNEARMQTLFDMGKDSDTRRLADEIILKAREHNLPQHEVIALALLAHFAAAHKEFDSPIRTFNQVIKLGEKSGFVREVADAQSALADIYRGTGDLEQAEHFADLAVATTQESGNEWAVPECQRTLAEIQAMRGSYADADETYDRAGAFVDALLGRYSGTVEKIALVKVSSELYTGHFSLLADRLHNPSKAYEVLEQVRGRVMTDLLLAGAVTSDEARAEQWTLSRLRLKLMSVHSATETRRLRDQMFMAQQARWVTPEISILKADPNKTVSIDQIQQSLGRQAAILEYVIADPRSYCLVISRGGHRIVQLTSQQQIQTLAIA
jgi:tetratricopeptide (TPR) repeat protein